MAGARAEDAPQPEPAATPSGQKSGGAGRPRRQCGGIRLPPPSSIACRRIPRPNKRWPFPGARSPLRPRRVRSACSTTRASRRPISPTPPISWMARIRATRPVTFFFNGGPGAASAWLQFGAAGPWRLAINADAVSSSASPDLQPNAETWLDFTDLVFIDPVGTGYSRFVATGEDVRKTVLFGRRRRQLDRVDDPPLAGKIRPAALAQIHRRRKLWRHSRTEDRQQSAAPAGRRGEGTDPGLAGARLPRIFRLQHAAICLRASPPWQRWRAQAKGAVTRADLADVESYARGDFLTDLVKGAGRRRGHHAPCRQGGGLDGDRSGGEPQAGRALRRRRVSPRIRPQERQGDGTLRCLGDGPRSRSGFELLSFRRSLRRTSGRAADQRRGRSHHAQAQLAAGRVLRIAQRRGREGLGFRPRPQARRIDFTSCDRFSRSTRS